MAKPYDGVMTKANVLVVEDEQAIREIIEDALNLAGYTANACSNPRQGLELLKKNSYDLIITDVMMPGMDGFDFVTKVREAGNSVPVIFLTARNQKLDINTGFRVGGDDYVSKPFGIEELTLRVAAVLRRTMKNDSSDLLVCGPISLSVDKHQVWLNDNELNLSLTEFRLLQYLLENKGKSLSKVDLLDEIWGMGFAEQATVLDTYISYLRKKLHSETYQGIKTVRGYGFKIEC